MSGRDIAVAGPFAEPRFTRYLDFTGALVTLLLLSPLFLVIALAIRLTSPGPILYRARRVGRGGRPFHLYKFRSMVADADSVGGAITRAADPRITPIGRLLRNSKLDELPQLLNVLKGQMSFVGPRPEDPKYVALYTPQQRRLLSVRPGITSVASIRYRREETLLEGDDVERLYTEEILPQKLMLELEYLKGRTIRSDLCVLLQTAWTVIAK